jgi:hypothetical protein
MMSEKWNMPKPKILIILLLIACVVIVMSIPRFGYIYPDSSYYLDMVEFFSGTLLGSELAAPFCFRPMLPLIVAFLPLEAGMSFAIINTIFLILIAWIIFFSSLKRDPSPLVAFLTTLVFIVSLLFLFYGAVVLVDPGAVFFLSLAYYYMTDEGQGKKIAILLTLGVLFKEIALVGVLAYLLYGRLKEWWLMVLPLGTYAVLRVITPSSNPDYIWAFHLDTFVNNGAATSRTFLFGLTPFLILLILAYLHQRRTTLENDETNKWLIAGGIPAVAYLILGLFFAHFDVRFFWPTYLILIPLCTDGVSEFFRFIRSLLGSVSTTE